MADFGVLAQHMATHIVAMNVAAPLAALVWHLSDRRDGSSSSRWLWSAAVLQLALLFGWHAPAVLPFAFTSNAALAAMHLSLFLAALWFWLAVIGAAGQAAWRSLAALLVTGKIFCLAGVLLAFAQRPIYSALEAGHHSPAPAVDLLADQQLAGLLMLIACPLTYVLAGLVIAARWLSGLERQREGGIRRRVP